MRLQPLPDLPARQKSFEQLLQQQLQQDLQQQESGAATAAAADADKAADEEFADLGYYEAEKDDVIQPAAAAAATALHQAPDTLPPQ